jgi:hypothetical protein
MAQEGMMGIMNAFYSQYISEKRRGQFEALRERTKYVATKAPMGTRSEGKGMERRIKVSDETYETQGGERKLIDTVIAFFQMYVDNDWGVRQCALELDARGHLWKHGKRLVKIKWQTLRKILDLVELYYEIGAIDKTLYHRVLRRMEQCKLLFFVNWIGRESLMLARLVYCAECKSMMTAENRGEYYNSIYRHQHNACRWGAAVSARIVDRLFKAKMEGFGEYTQDDLNQLFANMRGQQGNTIDYAAKRERTLLMLENLENAYLAGDLGDLPTARPHYLARKSKLKTELDEIPTIIESPIDEQFTLDSLSQFIEWMGQVEESLPHRMNGLIREFVERVEFNMKTKEIQLFFVWDT